MREKRRLQPADNQSVSVTIAAKKPKIDVPNVNKFHHEAAGEVF